LQGLGPTGAEFMLAFDNGKSNGIHTLMLTDWIAHTPPDVLAANFGGAGRRIQEYSARSAGIFQGKDPGPLAADERAVKSANGARPIRSSSR